MSKYIIGFSKTGTICYTSHLDLMRIWKRAFKRSAIALAYSQGFNPHPKMGFAQPLSLGYWGMEEYIEFETADAWDPDQLLQKLEMALPEGIDLKQCLTADRLPKTLASHTVAAQYMIEVPVEKSCVDGAAGVAAAAEGAGDGAPAADSAVDAAANGAPAAGDAAVSPDPEADLSDPRALWHSLMDLDEILVWKRQKKKKEPKLVDIKPMIREITFTPGDSLFIDVVLDCGSDSNLSPELIISSVLKRFCIPTDRSEISVMRKKILFDQPLEKLRVAL